jgi:hypothetical protein
MAGVVPATVPATHAAAAASVTVVMSQVVTTAGQLVLAQVPGPTREWEVMAVRTTLVPCASWRWWGHSSAAAHHATRPACTGRCGPCRLDKRDAASRDAHQNDITATRILGTACPSPALT